MCGFFAFYTGLSPREIAEQFGLGNLPQNLGQIQSLKFYPRSNIPTISKNSPNQLVLRYWQLIPNWFKDDPAKMKFSTFNARSEEIETKPTFRHAWKNAQRCLIPATWFYEFETLEGETKSKKQKIPFKVSLKDQEIFGIAGLYEDWTDATGQVISSCTILTTESVKPLSQIHHRQPVIIDKTNWQKWLDKNTPKETIEKLLVPTKELILEKLDPVFNKMSASELESSSVL